MEPDTPEGVGRELQATTGQTALWLGRNQRRAPFKFDAARV